MIELELYRRRIGTFRCKLTSNKRQDVKVSSQFSAEQRSRVKTMFIVLTVGLCLVLLGCQLETTCHKVLRCARSVFEQYLHGEVKGNMFYNVINTLKFRNYFHLSSYILTKEQKYQLHDDSKNYTPKVPVQIHVDNTSTPELVDVGLIVERHGAASYLLGNAGQHAYNGNPHNGHPDNGSTPKRRRYDDAPSTSVDEEIKNLHFTMVNELHKHLYSDYESEWTSFKGVLRKCDRLSPKDIAGFETMFDVCENLKQRGYIAFGNYDELKTLFTLISNMTCYNIVDDFLTQMKEIEKKQAGKEKSESEQEDFDSEKETPPKKKRSSKEPTDYMELVVKSWKEQDKLCYETEGVKAVKEKICNDSCVCVIGVPGSGKSTAIRHAALHLQKTSQYKYIYPIKTPKEFKKYLDENKTQVFVMDDIVGEYSVDKEKLGLWDSYNDEIKRCLDVSKNTKFLTSLRLQLYLDETLKGKTYIFNDPDKKVSFSDKDFKLSLDDMKNMLRHYLQVRNVGNSEALIEDICGERWWERGWEWWGWAAESADYFPLLCKVFSENESVRENPEKFFTAPFPALTDIFRQIKSKNKHQFCGLLLCAFMELKREYFSPHYPHDKPEIFTSLIESQKLDPKKDLDDIENALHSLDGVYISHVANKYDFSHSTFRDITTFLYEDKYVIFQHATRDFIESRVRLFSKLSEDDDYVLVFHGEDCIELLVNRMIHELKCQTEWGEGVEFIVENRYIDDERVVNALCTKLFDSQDTDITQDRVDELFDSCMYAVWWYSVRHTDNRDEMSWPCYKLLVRLIPRVDCTRQIGVRGTYPVFLCVWTGSLSLTKLVVQQNSAVINTVDICNHSVLHKALWCVNNVDMTRYLLSLPNLRRLNHRNKYNRSPYWYVVHRQIANRQEMMDIYKQAGAIALGDSSDDDINVDDNDHEKNDDDGSDDGDDDD